MVHDLHDHLTNDFTLLIGQADELELIDNVHARKHVAALNDKIETLTNQIYMLEKAIKKYSRLNMIFSDESFSGLVDRMLNDHAFLENEGYQTELMRVAADKKTESLYEIHQYGDGSIDPPIMNWESVERMKQNEG